MKIIIEEEYELINKTGIGYYTLLLCAILDKLKIEYIMYKKDSHKIFFRNSYLKNICYILWYNTIFILKMLLLNDTAILIATNFYLPIIKLKNVKYIPVIHDIKMFKFPQSMSKIGGLLFRARIKNAIAKSDYIITVSNTIKNEIIEYFNYPEDRIFVVYSSPNIKLSSDNKFLKKYSVAPQKYILSVSTQNKNKNMSSLIKAFN